MEISKQMIMPNLTTTSVKKAKKEKLKPVAINRGSKPKYFIGFNAAVEKLFKANSTVIDGQRVIVTPDGRKMKFDLFKSKMNLLKGDDIVNNDIQFQKLASIMARSTDFINYNDPIAAKEARFSKFGLYDMFGYERRTRDKNGKSILMADFVRQNLRDEKGRFLKYDPHDAKIISSGQDINGSFSVYRYNLPGGRYIQWRRYNSFDHIFLERNKDGNLVQSF